MREREKERYRKRGSEREREGKKGGWKRDNACVKDSVFLK